MKWHNEAADRVTGRALALAMTPGIHPALAVAELVALAGADFTALEAAGMRFRACLRDTPDSAWARLALDLCQEAQLRFRSVPA